MVYLTLKQTALGWRDHPFSGLSTSLSLAWASDLSLQLLPLPTCWDPLFLHAPRQPVPGGYLETLRQRCWKPGDTTADPVWAQWGRCWDGGLGNSYSILEIYTTQEGLLLKLKKPLIPTLPEREVVWERGHLRKGTCPAVSRHSHREHARLSDPPGSPLLLLTCPPSVNFLPSCPTWFLLFIKTLNFWFYITCPNSDFAPPSGHCF